MDVGETYDVVFSTGGYEIEYENLKLKNELQMIEYENLKLMNRLQTIELDNLKRMNRLQSTHINNYNIIKDNDLIIANDIDIIE